MDDHLKELSHPDVTHRQEWTVSANEDRGRLDRFVAARLPHVSRRALIAFIAAGRIRLNHRRIKKGTPVQTGDTVQAYIDRQLQPNPSLSIPVVYAETAVLVLDKPAKMPSVALRLTQTNTVANFLLARFPETAVASPSPLEAGIVHRLDTATSGLLVATRTRTAYTALRRQFSACQVEKFYLARVVGHFSFSGQTRFFLSPAGKRGQRMQVFEDQYGNRNGQEAISTYTPIERSAHSTLVRIQIHTGVRHQIRAHLASLGYPVMGDTLYGAPGGAQRLKLHAESIRFVHPETKKSVHIMSPASADFCVDQETHNTENG